MNEKMKADFYIVETNAGIAFADEDKGTKQFWLGGSPSLVFIPLFKSKKEARKFQRKVRRSKNVAWTKIWRAKIVEED